MARRNRTRQHVYGSYIFRDKDPVIDELRTIVEDHFGGRVTRKHLTMMEHSGGPSAGCMVGWFFGETRRPLNPSIEASGRAIGFRRRWVRDTELAAKGKRLLKRNTKAKRNGKANGHG